MCATSIEQNICRTIELGNKKQFRMAAQKKGNMSMKDELLNKNK